MKIESGKIKEQYVTLPKIMISVYGQFEKPEEAVDDCGKRVCKRCAYWEKGCNKYWGICGHPDVRSDVSIGDMEISSEVPIKTFCRFGCAHWQ